jgi:hypothetical protein
MIYSSTILTEKNTLELQAKRTFMKVTNGLVYLFEVQIPPGPAGLLSIQIFDGAFQLLPYTRGEALSGDDVLFNYDDLYMKNAEPFQFEIKTWNLDDTFEHTCWVHIGLVSEEIYKARFLPALQWDYFQKMLKAVEQDQEQKKKEQAFSGFTILGKARE